MKGLKKIISNATICPKCGSDQTNVFNSRTVSGYVHRRRRCLSCGECWSSYEITKEDLEKILEVKVVNRFEKVSLEQFTKDMLDTFPYMTVEDIKAMYDSVKIPKRGSKLSAGYDFSLPFALRLEPNEIVKVPTGIRCIMDDNLFLMCVPRSGLGFKYGMRLLNTVGIIDADYKDADNEGHIMIKVQNGDKKLELSAGDRFAQGILVPYVVTDDDNADGSRIGGFGSTGV